MRCRVSRQRSPHPSGRTCRPVHNAALSWLRSAVTLLARNSGRATAVAEGARDRFLQRIASAPVVKPQEKLTEVTPIDVKTKRRGAGFWCPG